MTTRLHDSASELLRRDETGEAFSRALDLCFAKVLRGIEDAAPRAARLEGIAANASEAVQIAAAMRGFARDASVHEVAANDFIVDMFDRSAAEVLRR